ncbi:MAG: hypothetical protein RJS97_02005 [Parvibaculaceae bacterium]
MKAPAIEQFEACRQTGAIDHGLCEGRMGLILAACPGKDGSTSSMVGCYEIERQYWASQIVSPLQTLRNYKAKYDSDDEYAVAPVSTPTSKTGKSGCETNAPLQAPGMAGAALAVSRVGYARSGQLVSVFLNSN